MSFPFLSSNAFFWWLLTLAIPVVIHLLNRRRHRVVQWAAMDFLLKATRESKGKKKLKHIIILTCRALAIAALVLAVARPLLSNGLFSWGSNKIDTVILVLDRSASMELDSSDPALTKREKILQLTQSALSGLGNARLVLIDSATATPLPIASPSTLHEIAHTQATDTSASIPALLSTAIEYILDNDSGRTEIWLASDMQKGDWASENGQWENVRTGLANLQEQASLRVISLRNSSSNNLTGSVIKAQRVGNELLLEIAINQDEGSKLQQTTLTISHNGVSSSEAIELAGQSTVVNKRLSLEAKSGFGYVQLPSDANTRDNTSYFSYGAELPIHTAVVAPKGEAQFYLGLAAAPPGYANQISKLYSPTQPLPFSSLSLIVWQAPLPTGETQQQLLDFVDRGGVVTFFPPNENDITQQHSFLDTSWGLPNKAAEGKFFIIDDWTRNEGPLRNGEDGTPIPLTKLRAIQRRAILTDATSLADWTDGSSFLTRQFHGRGAVYFISSIPDYTWSTLGDADVLLPLIQRSLLKGNQRLGEDLSITVGNLPPAISLDSTNRKRLDNATQSSPLNQEFEAGVFRIGDRTVAVNRPNSEDSIQQLPNELLDQLLLGTDFRLFEDNSKASSKTNLQLWQPLLIAMLAFMLIEATLCLVKKRSLHIAPKT